MLLRRYINGNSHPAVHWLLVAAMVAGLLSTGAFIALGAASPCGVSCPCDGEKDAQEAKTETHANCGCDENNEGTQSNEVPCNEKCPDDCPDCNCCSGLMVGLTTTLVPVLPPHAFSPNLLNPHEVPTYGYKLGIYRPPRSRAENILTN